MEAPFINIHQALLTHWFSLVNNSFKLMCICHSLFSFFVGNHGTTV
jgi:hypothetical protein